MKKRIVVLSGAGVSAESGLSTYRDNGGLWDGIDPYEVASADAWERQPGKVLEFYNIQRRKLAEARPNEAHRAIAGLEKDYIVDVITQNIDNLHERAGSTHVVHLHGEATKIRPENTCNESDGFSEQYVVDCGYGEVNIGDIAPNGAQYRPHIVFFGEAVPKLERAIDLVEKADILLIIGTSLQVYPAAGLYRYARASTPIWIIDPAEIPLYDRRITHIKKKACEGMEDFVRELRQE